MQGGAFQRRSRAHSIGRARAQLLGEGASHSTLVPGKEPGPFASVVDLTIWRPSRSRSTLKLNPVPPATTSCLARETPTPRPRILSSDSPTGAKCDVWMVWLFASFQGGGDGADCHSPRASRKPCLGHHLTCPDAIVNTIRPRQSRPCMWLAAHPKSQRQTHPVGTPRSCLVVVWCRCT
jgi:hypothetical protein